MADEQGKAWNPADPTPDQLEAFRWGYKAGWEAGRAAVRLEINEAWQNVTRVFSASDWADVPTAAERKAEREMVLRQAHDAGLHDKQVMSCPLCVEGKAPTMLICYQCGHAVMGHGVNGCSATVADHVLCRCEASSAMLLARVPHSGDYGVPDAPTGDVMSRARLARGGRGEVDAPLGKFAQAAADARTVGDFRCTTHGMRGCPSC